MSMTMKQMTDLFVAHVMEQQSYRQIPLAERPKVSLAKCPPGPFLFEGTLGFKTDYGKVHGTDAGGGKVHWEMSNDPDIYVMSNGDAFWGGAKSQKALNALMVLPLNVEDIPKVIRQGAS